MLELQEDAPLYSNRLRVAARQTGTTAVCAALHVRVQPNYRSAHNNAIVSTALRGYTQNAWRNRTHRNLCATPAACAAGRYM